ncbi:hypothetical protein WDZ92_30250 [Nostoc sp. NIES-2111]
MHTDLLGDPLPEPLPSNSRLTRMSDLVGHEVRAVFDETQGTYGHAAMVIVTATGCWLALDIEGCDLDDAYISVYSEHNPKPIELIGYVPAAQLLNENCITDAEYRRLKVLEDEHAETERQRKANHLRRQLAELEGKAQ